MKLSGHINGEPIHWHTTVEDHCVAIVATVRTKRGGGKVSAVGITHEDMAVSERWPRLLKGAFRALELGLREEASSDTGTA